VTESRQTDRQTEELQQVMWHSRKGYSNYITSKLTERDHCTSPETASTLMSSSVFLHSVRFHAYVAAAVSTIKLHTSARPSVSAGVSTNRPNEFMYHSFIQHVSVFC